MKFACLDRWLSAAKDWHIPITVCVFITGTVLQWFGHLSTEYVGFTATVLGALVGHSFSPAQQDKGADNATIAQ